MTEAHYADAVTGHNFGEFSALSTDLTASQYIGTELHRYAEALLAGLAADESPSTAPPDLSDVTDYWLAPAVEALELVMRGEDALEPSAVPPSSTSSGPPSSSVSPLRSRVRARPSTPHGWASPSAS